jgi:hypothetical protein
MSSAGKSATMIRARPRSARRQLRTAVAILDGAVDDDHPTLVAAGRAEWRA